MKASIVVGIASHGDPELTPVPFADDDARELAAVLERHGFAAEHRLLLVNEEASKTATGSKIRRLLKGLEGDDALYFYFAGHGFSAAGESYLACFDTQSSDLEETSLSLAWLFDQLRACRCGKIVLLLDANHGGPLPANAMSGLATGLNDAQLQSLLDSRENAIGLVSCQAHELSHTSSELGHGIWAYHLIEALSGQARLPLDGTRLTATALQEHLQTAVPRTLRKTSPEAVQTPWLHPISRGGLTIADLADVAAETAGIPTAGQIKSMTLLSETRASIRSLAGFKKRDHHLPDRLSDSTQQFINSLAAPELQNELDVVHAALKGSFRFKRADLDVSSISEGAGTITTPYFNYNVSIQQDPQDPAGIVWRRTIDAIRDPDQILSPAFQTVFERRFSTLEIALHGGIQIEELIDRIEALDDPNIQVDYPTDLAWCQIRLRGVSATIHVTRQTLSIVHLKPESPRQLLESFFKIQRSLNQTHDVALPFEPAE